METNQEKLLKIAQAALDTDPTPADTVPDEVACSQVLTTLLRKVFPDIPVMESTVVLFNYLKKDKRFKATLDPGITKLIVSPRIGDTPGHCGIWINNQRIASNNSKTGLFQGNYDFNSWINTFGSNGRNLHTYIFQLVD